MGPTHAVRLHDALGGAGGAGGIDDVERHLRADPGLGHRRAGGCQPGLVRLACVAAVQRDDGRGGQPVAHGLQHVGHGGIREQDARARRRATMPARLSGVDDGASGAPPRCARRPGTPRRIRSRTTRRWRCFAGAHAVAGQRRDNAVHGGIETGIVEHALAMHQGALRGALRGVLAHEHGHGGEGALERGRLGHVRQGNAGAGVAHPKSNDGSKQTYWICAPESFTTLLQRLISASIWVRSAAGVEPPAHSRWRPVWPSVRAGAAPWQFRC